MTDRIRIFARGLVSLLALAVLVVGPPVALSVFVGWPLPEGMPTVDELTTGARSGIDPAVIVQTLAIIGWVAWAQIALAVAIEAVALLRRTPAPHLPVLPGVQLGAGRLLASTALLFASFSPARQAPVPLVAAAPIADIAPQPAPAPVPPVAAPAAAPFAEETSTTSSGPATVSYQVERNDSWWQIAETTLGDGLRWQEIRTLNTGRTMPDRTTITPTTEVIHEGWKLLVPANASGPTEIPAADVVVEPGDNLWDLAEDHLEAAIDRQADDGEITPYWLDVIEENRPRLPNPSNPSLIHPGQTVHLPAHGDGAASPDAQVEPPPKPATDVEPTEPDDPIDDHGQPAIPADPSTTTTSTSTSTPSPASTPTTTAPTIADRGDEQSGDRDSDESSIGIEELLGTAGTLLAVGLSAAVLRRRRRREQLLPAASQVPDPPEALDPLRTEIARRADLDQTETLDAAMVTVATALAGRRDDARVRIVQATTDRVEALLSAPVLPAPQGWRPEASGSAWVLDDPSALDLPEPRPMFSTHPLLVSLGAADTTGQIYLDLEAEGLLNIHGTHDHTAGFTRSLILELANSPFASGAAIYACGDVPGAPETQPDRTFFVASWADIADSILCWAHRTRDLQAARRWATPSAGRATTDQPDDLAPMVVVLADEPDDERFTALCTIISESIVPVVILGVDTNIEGATNLEIADGELHIAGLGLTCAVQTIDNDTAHDIDALLHASEQIPDRRDEGAEAPPSSNGHRPAPVGDRYTDPPFDVLVKVLGEIEVIGGNQPLTPKPTAVVTYVALHSPVSAERVEDAVWSAPTENRRKRLANTVSDTRSALGPEHLPPAQDGKYRTGPRVVTDLELLDRRLRYAETQTGEAATETLRGALELVTGPVFSYRNADRAAFSWVDTGNWISSTELKVTQLAEDLAQRYLAAKDFDAAVWAARRGLTSVPTHSRLTGLLMRAHVAAGDPHAALTVYESHISALEALDLDDVDPDLADLYRDIRSGWTTAPKT